MLLSRQRSISLRMRRGVEALLLELEFWRCFPPGYATVPTITSLSPNSATAGGPAFTLTINGTNFTSAATSKWGSTALAVTYKSTSN